jgi:hypothetical protein
MKRSGDPWLMYIFLRIYTPFAMGNVEMIGPLGSGKYDAMRNNKMKG